MTDTHDLTERNAAFAASAFTADLKINPAGNMMVVGCVDPRVFSSSSITPTAG